MAITLNVEKRDIKTDVATLRAAGKIPAVFYGKKEASTPIAISLVDFIKTYIYRTHRILPWHKQKCGSEWCRGIG